MLTYLDTPSLAYVFNSIICTSAFVYVFCFVFVLRYMEHNHYYDHSKLAMVNSHCGKFSHIETQHQISIC